MYEIKTILKLTHGHVLYKTLTENSQSENILLCTSIFKTFLYLSSSNIILLEA